VKILGIESSCDETAAAVVEDGHRLISNVVQSQIDLHAAFGGVVPEVAARSHLEVILPVIDKAVQDAGGWDQIDAIACTTMPGLIGSLLIGSLTARTLALIKNKPFYPVHHVEAHVYANFIDRVNTASAGDYSSRAGSDVTTSASTTELRDDNARERSDRRRIIRDFEEIAVQSEGVVREGISPGKRAGKNRMLRDEEKCSESSDYSPAFPMLALIVSGGHSQIVLFRDHGDYTLIGQTQDDAVGEAFDKVAKILGLPYPGGPSIAKAAEHGDPHAYNFPKAKMSGKYDFSFSGLKTAVLRTAQLEVGKDHTFPSSGLSQLLNTSQRNNFAASFQHTAVETLVDKVIAAYEEFHPESVVIGGGVAANQELRCQLAERLPITIKYPAPELCTYNAAMVASLGYFMASKISPTNPLDVEIQPSVSMTKTAWNLSK